MIAARNTLLKPITVFVPPQAIEWQAGHAGRNLNSHAVSQ